MPARVNHEAFRWVLRQRVGSGRHKATLAHLALGSDPDGEISFTLAELAQELSISPRTCKVHLQALVDHDLIAWFEQREEADRRCHEMARLLGWPDR